jgi:hypothetical protein
MFHPFEFSTAKPEHAVRNEFLSHFFLFGDPCYVASVYACGKSLQEKNAGVFIG